jgi:hypothetical protein
MSYYDIDSILTDAQVCQQWQQGFSPRINTGLQNPETALYLRARGTGTRNPRRQSGRRCLYREDRNQFHHLRTEILSRTLLLNTLIWILLSLVSNAELYWKLVLCVSRFYKLRETRLYLIPPSLPLVVHSPLLHRLRPSLYLMRTISEWWSDVQ